MKCDDNSEETVMLSDLLLMNYSTKPIQRHENSSFVDIKIRKFEFFNHLKPVLEKKTELTLLNINFHMNLNHINNLIVTEI